MQLSVLLSFLCTMAKVTAQAECGDRCGTNAICNSDGKCEARCAVSDCCSPGTCSTPGTIVCVGLFDPFCNTVWDMQCRNEAVAACGLICTASSDNHYYVMLSGYPYEELLSNYGQVIFETADKINPDGENTWEQIEHFQIETVVWQLSTSKSIDSLEFEESFRAKIGAQTRRTASGMPSISVSAAPAGDDTSAYKRIVNTIPTQPVQTETPKAPWYVPFEKSGVGAATDLINTAIPGSKYLLGPLSGMLFAKSAHAVSWTKVELEKLNNEISTVNENVLKVEQDVKKISLQVSALAVLVENDFDAQSMKQFTDASSAITNLWVVTAGAFIPHANMTIADYYKQLYNAYLNLLQPDVQSILNKLHDLYSATVNLLSDLTSAANEDPGPNLLQFCMVTTSIIQKFVADMGVLNIMADMAYAEYSISGGNSAAMASYNASLEKHISELYAMTQTNQQVFCRYLQGEPPANAQNGSSIAILSSSSNDYLSSRTEVSSSFSYASSVPFTTGPFTLQATPYTEHPALHYAQPISLLQTTGHQQQWYLPADRGDLDDNSRTFQVITGSSDANQNVHYTDGTYGPVMLNENFAGQQTQYPWTPVQGLNSDKTYVQYSAPGKGQIMEWAFGYTSEGIAIYLVPATTATSVLMSNGNNLPVALLQVAAKSASVSWKIHISCVDNTSEDCPALPEINAPLTEFYYPVELDAGSCDDNQMSWHIYAPGNAGTTVNIGGTYSTGPKIWTLMICTGDTTNCQLGTYGFVMPGQDGTYANGAFQLSGTQFVQSDTSSSEAGQDMYCSQWVNLVDGSQYCSTLDYHCQP